LINTLTIDTAVDAAVIRTLKNFTKSRLGCRIMMLYQSIYCFLLLGLNLLFSSAYAALNLDYSNQITHRFTHELAVYLPEKASEIGFTDYDDRAGNMTADFDEKLLCFYQSWHKKLLNLASLTHTHDDLIDLKLLSDYVQNQINEIKLNHAENVIPFVSGTQVVFQNLKTLINAQTNQARKTNAVKRFHAYVQSNFLYHNQAYIEAGIQKYAQDKAYYPGREQLHAYLTNSPIYIDAVKQLLESSNEQGWERDFVEYQAQAEAFDAFVREVLLPHAQQISAMPEALYRQQLQNYGVKEADVDTMISVGQRDYAALYQEYQVLAQKIAVKYHLDNATPQAVIAFLKREQIISPKDVMALYKKASIEIEGIINTHHILTLPSEPLNIRLGTLAESKAMPAPHIYMPPRINNEGMAPEFIIPMKAEGLPYDDFTYLSITIALMAHEGRPGHDLHLRRVLSPPMSLVRASYAENPVNHEGWALYAEDLIYPYVDIEAQFGIVQMRLLRIARYFLDPLVQQNKATEADVIAVLHDELGISQALAEVEYQRYAYIAPAQATTYYHGLLKIRALKKALTEDIGELSSQCFHDTLLSFGLMPTEYVFELKERFKSCKV
jgi:uncharacterized protein (DUF885 family)